MLQIWFLLSTRSQCRPRRHAKSAARTTSSGPRSRCLRGINTAGGGISTPPSRARGRHLQRDAKAAGGWARGQRTNEMDISMHKAVAAETPKPWPGLCQARLEVVTTYAPTPREMGSACHQEGHEVICRCYVCMLHTTCKRRGVHSKSRMCAYL